PCWSAPAAWRSRGPASSRSLLRILGVDLGFVGGPNGGGHGGLARAVAGGIVRLALRRLGFGRCVLGQRLLGSSLAAFHGFGRFLGHAIVGLGCLGSLILGFL